MAGLKRTSTATGPRRGNSTERPMVVGAGAVGLAPPEAVSGESAVRVLAVSSAVPAVTAEPAEPAKPALPAEPALPAVIIVASAMSTLI